MKQLIKDINRKLREKNFSNEEQVRVCIVLRILQKLGWEIWDPLEVYEEFPAVRKEDSSRVDIALFQNRYSHPSVFIEIKTLGKVQTDLRKIERQMRDYNRNNTAEFSVITDGREWRFYYSQTGGGICAKMF